MVNGIGSALKIATCVLDNCFNAYIFKTLWYNSTLFGEKGKCIKNVFKYSSKYGLSTE